MVKGSRTMFHRQYIGLLAIVLISPGLAHARKPGDPLKPGHNFYSPQQDIQIGRIQAAQVKMHYPVVPNEFLQAYIRRVGQRLAATPEAVRSEFPFEFTLLNVPAVNAFALPGGPMFIFTGLVKSTASEAQLAGVMAHEMSHVILRHGTHELTKKQTTGLAAGLAAALGTAALGNQAGLAQLTRMGMGLGENSLILHFSRDAESEADLLGSHLMAEAGYDPLEMARFFETLAQTGSTGVQFFSDHPNPDNRERAIEEEVQALPKRAYGYQTGEFERAKLEVSELPPAGRGGVRPAAPLPPQMVPATTWKFMTVKSYRVSLPQNWNGYGSSASDSLIIAPTGGVSRTPQGAIDLSFGMMLGYFQPESKQMTLGTATLNLIARLHSQDQTIEMASPQQRTIHAGNTEAMITLLKASSQTLGPEANVLYTMLRNEGLFYALAIAPQRNYPELQQTFTQILNSIQFAQ
ncbi:MAG TPA: M48 family metalloprotease [Bryobacteraceae bacterium]|nr:M48 family metalloprotease [Bryobacteraceae bacterium]